MFDAYALRMLMIKLLIVFNIRDVIEVPRGVLKKLDYFRSRFFWQSDDHKKKYRLTKWR
jgi:hypothetical protein